MIPYVDPSPGFAEDDVAMWLILPMGHPLLGESIEMFFSFLVFLEQIQAVDYLPLFMDYEKRINAGLHPSDVELQPPNRDIYIYICISTDITDRYREMLVG